MKNSIFVVAVLTLIISACSPTIAATPTPTYDPCAQEIISVEVEKVHEITRSFDDAARLASYTPRDQLNIAIANLDSIRTKASDLVVPHCLELLKGYQIGHMNSVIDTLVAFQLGVQPEVITAGIEQARIQRATYDIEMALLLGVTFTPVPTRPMAVSSLTYETPIATDQTPTPGYEQISLYGSQLVQNAFSQVILDMGDLRGEYYAIGNYADKGAVFACQYDNQFPNRLVCNGPLMPTDYTIYFKLYLSATDELVFEVDLHFRLLPTATSVP